MLLVLLACANPDYIRLYYAADKAPSLSWEAIGNPAEAPRAGGRRASMRRRRVLLPRPNAVAAGPKGTVCVAPNGRYRSTGDVTGWFFHSHGMHRYEVGELDAWADGLRVPDGADFPWGDTTPLRAATRHSGLTRTS